MFGSFNYTQETLEEHDRYALWIGAWCMISGFGEYVTVDKELKPGEDGFVKPALEADGSQRVILPHMLVGMLLEMASGAKSTPKGGLGKLLEAHGAACQAAAASGQFGEGAYKNEPWSLVRA